MSVRIDNKDLTLALSAGALACLVPRDPFGSHAYLTLATYGFVSLAVLNHLFAKRLQAATAAVKALYTQMLCASVGVGMPIAWSISVLDLSVLGIASKRLRNAAEDAGAVARVILIVMGFASIRFNPLVLVPYLAFNYLYFRERRARIREDRRFDYGWPHHFEHLALWLYFYAVNHDALDLARVHAAAGLYAGAIVLVSLLAVTAINVRLHSRWRRDLPAWFDSRLLDEFRKKIRNNLASLKWHNHVTKSFNYAVSNERMTWRRIEQMVDEIEVAERFDLAVGVLSGGAFIARYVCVRLEIGALVYVRSKVWSGTTLVKTALNILRYLLRGSFECERIELDDSLDVSGKRVLLIDDTVTTGTTMEGVARALRARGAAEVKTYALVCNRKHQPHYFHRMAPVPFIWPWGAEVD
jgi:hypoxanthine phosphoribosyltransferase